MIQPVYNRINRRMDVILEGQWQDTWHRDVEENKPTWKDVIAEYNWLLTNLRRVDVYEDEEYQSRFQNFWDVDLRHARGGVMTGYPLFLSLEESKDKEGVVVWPDQICRAAEDDYFQFAAAMSHTINPRLPAMRNSVSRFFGFPEGICSRTEEMEQYDVLVDEYRRVLSCGLLKPAIDGFRLALSTESLTDEAIIEFLIWGNERT
jgi:hypothetical protein